MLNLKYLSSALKEMSTLPASASPFLDCNKDLQKQTKSREHTEFGCWQLPRSPSPKGIHKAH